MKRGDISKLREAAEKLHGSDRDYRRASNVDFVVYLLLVVFIAISVRTFIAEPVRVDGYSMYPTLEDTERMIVEKLSYAVGKPQRGDIIVCYYPGYTLSCVKRVIGLPGDRVKVENGSVYVNGNRLDERDYIREEMGGAMGERVVEEGCVLVMGDNRNHSTDSRSSGVGDIPYEKIVGRVMCVVWPFDTMRVVKHVNYPNIGLINCN